MTRDVFAELVEGFDALAAERQGKATLRSHKVQLGALATVSAPISAADPFNACACCSTSIMSPELKASLRRSGSNS